MLYREIIAVCSEIHTKHINTLCGQNVELLNVKVVVHIVTTEPWRVKYFTGYHVIFCIFYLVAQKFFPPFIAASAKKRTIAMRKLVSRANERA